MLALHQCNNTKNDYPVGNRLVQLFHEDELLCEDQSEGAVARLEGGAARQDPIIELRLLLLLRL